VKRALGVCSAAVALAMFATPARAEETPSPEPAADSSAVAGAPADSVDAVESPRLAARPVPAAPAARPLEALEPEVAARPWYVEPGVRSYRQRLSFSPAYGDFGSQRYFAARLSFNPLDWLGYEWSLGHTPGQSTHAALHTISAMVRRPFPGRFQPYLSVGYGMVMVFPGPSINAAPVTKNALLAGGGLELFLRSDLAIRGEMRSASVFGRQRDRAGVVTYSYGQQTIGLAFYRTLKP
jgi:hypothetical protein